MIKKYTILTIILIFILSPIKVYASTVETQQSTIGIKGTVLANADYDVIIPIDTYYKVTFDSAGGSPVQLQFVRENCNAIEPAAPTRANYEFNFWVEKGTYERFNFTTTPITHDITLKAVWTEIPSITEPEDEPDTPDTPDTDDESEESEDGPDTPDNTEDNSPDQESDNTPSTDGNTDNSNGSDSLTDSTEPQDETDTPILDNNQSNQNTNPNSKPSQSQSQSTEIIFEERADSITDPDKGLLATIQGLFKIVSKSIITVAKISITVGILLILLWFIFFIRVGHIKVQTLKDEYSAWKTVYITTLFFISTQQTQQNQEDNQRVWSISIPNRILNKLESNQIKVVLTKKFCSKANGEQLIIKINNKEYGFIVDIQETEIEFTI